MWRRRSTWTKEKSWSLCLYVVSSEWFNEIEKIYGLEERWVHGHHCLMDLEHGFVGLGSAHKTCRHRQMVDWTVQGRRIWCGASGCMIHYHKLEAFFFRAEYSIVWIKYTYHWIIKWPPLSSELQTHLVPLLGLLYRLVIGVARSGSVMVVGEEL